MAKTSEEFDGMIRKKLENHEEKPSAAAWEKLESRLPGKKTRSFGIWWAVAAGLSILLVSGWLFWNNSKEPLHKKQLAEEQPAIKKTEELPSSTAQVQELVASNQPEQIKISEKSIAKSKSSPLDIKNSNKVLNEESTSGAKPIKETTTDLVATVDFIPELPSLQVKTDLKPIEKSLLASETPISEKSITEATSLDQETTLVYRIKIYSDGLKKGAEPEKNLITEMGKTVGKVEGLLGKVDEGFAELQDKKNSLFAGLTTKK
jgi:hypothetical protein